MWQIHRDASVCHLAKAMPEHRLQADDKTQLLSNFNIKIQIDVLVLSSFTQISKTLLRYLRQRNKIIFVS